MYFLSCEEIKTFNQSINQSHIFHDYPGEFTKEENSPKFASKIPIASRVYILIVHFW